MLSGRLASLMRKEFIQFFRDKVLVILILWTFMEIALCGWALSFEVRHLSTAVYDLDKSQASRSLLQAFESTSYFDFNYYLEDKDQIAYLMDHGSIGIGIVIPPDFSENLHEGRKAQVQILVDGSNSYTASIALGYAAQIVRAYSRDVELERLKIASGELDPLPSVTNQIRSWYMPELKYAHFNMLSMLALAAIMLGILLPAATIVREKEAGTLEQLMVSPTRPYELILAKIVPMALVKMVGLGVGILESVLLFGVPINGSLTLFFLLSILVFFSSMGVGVWIATLSKNLQQALLLSFFILFPLLFLSGSMVSIQSMPLVLQYLSYLSPLRYYITITLGIFLKGVGMAILWPQAMALAAFGIFIFTVSIRRFRVRLA